MFRMKKVVASNLLFLNKANIRPRYPLVLNSLTSFKRFLSSTEGVDSSKSFKDGEVSSEQKTTTTDQPSPSSAASKEAEQISVLQKEVKDLKEQVLRSYAEEENVRRIARKDVDNAKAYANTTFAKSMLEVADDLERALSLVSVEQKTNGDPVLKSLVEGIEMTDKNLQKIFSKFNVIKYGNVNDVFDPSLHDALFQIPDASKTSGCPCH